VAIGKAEPAGIGGSADLHYALELARRGYVTLAPDYPNFGEYRCDPYARGYASGCMKAIWNNMRAVDLLQSLPEAEGGRLGCLGHSLGGHTALFTAAFEPRLRAVVSSCGFTAFAAYYGGNLAGWTGPTYMPRIKAIGAADRMPFDFHEVVAALAPRPFFASAPVRDHNFDNAGVRAVIRSAGQVYTLLGAADRLAASYPAGGHAFLPAEREAAYRFLDRWLR
jgi:dienelactone hydrolase